MEHKYCPLEFKDVDTGKRTVVFAHAAYSTLDRLGDIGERGMFQKTWQEKKDIGFLYNHEDPIGTTVRVFDDEQKAYTEGKFGKWKLADDVLEMADAGVIKGASYGYYTIRKEIKSVNGKSVRHLKEVVHNESSLLTRTPAHPDTGIVSLVKAEGIETLAAEIKSYIDTMEKFCRNAKASDETIQNILGEIKSAQHLLSQYDTATTQLATAPDASRTDNELLKQLLYTQILS